MTPCVSLVVARSHALPWQPRAVLVVDDDPQIRRSLARRLRMHDCVVDVAASFGAASAATRRYACALLDLELGDGSGVDLAHLLLARGIVRRVVFLSGTTDAVLVARAKQVGPFFAKTESASAVTEEVVRAADAATWHPTRACGER